MTGHEVSPRTPELPRLHRPEEIADALGCSAWWVKDRARRRLIPSTRVGRAYRFTAEHFTEIVRLHEERPARTTQRAAPAATPRSHASRPLASERESPARATPRLKARPPRRSDPGRYESAA